MNKNIATTIFESLASGIRLDVYRLLVRQGPNGMVAGEIASALDIPPTNLSFHLKALSQAGLLRAEQEGRFQRYRANMPLMQELIGYLTDECCGGQPAQCLGLSPVTLCPDGGISPHSWLEPETDIDAGFMNTYRLLHKPIEAFLKLPLTQIREDRLRLKEELNRIGSLLP